MHTFEFRRMKAKSLRSTHSFEPQAPQGVVSLEMQKHGTSSPMPLRLTYCERVASPSALP